MSIIVEIPGLLKVLTGGRAEVTGEGKNLMELLTSLETKFPGIKGHFFDKNGGLNNMVNIFVNEVDFHQLSGLDTPLSDGDHVRLAVAPLVSGGSGYDG
jgi:molybdopterin converting factor small subunit